MPTPNKETSTTQPTEDSSQDNQSNIERLANEMAETNNFLKTTFSFRMIILRGILTGFTIVLGSTVIASIIFALVQLVFGDVPYIPSENVGLPN
jgi:hypothetical protein